MTANW